MSEPDALATVTRLLDATNHHDLDGIVECFGADYRNETPAHPMRSFTGPDQVRRNWTAILSAVPDLRATIPAHVVDGDRVWGEWRMSGTRRDGAPHGMAGVIIFTVREGLIREAHFYLEPVERESGDVDDAVSGILAEGARP